MNTKENKHKSSSPAFTLIELITVITIMAIVAALVVTMGGAAQDKKKRTQVDGDKAKLVTMINNYFNKLNYYPPDNGLLATATRQVYDGLAATNPLLYELVGSTNTNSSGVSSLFVFNSTNSTVLLPATSYSNVFNRGGVGNGDAVEPHNFFQPGPASKEYGNYAPASAGAPPICGLLVPVELNSTLVPNFWHYDSSSTNRHNMTSFDLWAEFSVGSIHGGTHIITNGNW